jgi:hypothetical protein
MSRNVSFDTGPMRTTSNQQTLTIDEQQQLHQNTRGYYNPTMKTVHGYTSQVDNRLPNSYWQSENEKQAAINEATQAYWKHGPGVYKTPTGQEFELREDQAGNGLINVIACMGGAIGCVIIIAGIAKSMMFGAKKFKKRKSKKGKSKKGKSKKGKSKKGKSKRKY